MTDFKKIFLTFLNANSVDQNDSLLFGVSGGVDSMSLIHLAKSCGFKIIAAHLNYQLRDNESDLDEKLVHDFCKKNEIKLFTKKVDIDKNIQLEAREARYEFFDEIANKNKCNYIITAHHQNDDHETFLINMIRGSSIGGLKGIPEKRSNILRPGMCFNKSQLIEYAKFNRVPYREDLSNREDKYSRNFLRNQILHPIYQRFKNAENGLTKSMKFIKDDYALLAELIIEKLRPHIEERNGNILIHYKKEINPQCYFHFLKDFGFNFDQIERWISNPKQAGKYIISNEYQMTQDRSIWIISKRHQKIITRAEISENCTKITAPLELSFSVSSDISNNFSASSSVGFFDADKLIFPLIVRSWEHGDRIRPLGMKGTKKISDILIDKKIPLLEKNQTYVITSNEDIIWLVGHTINDHFKVNKTTNKILKIVKF